MTSLLTEIFQKLSQHPLGESPHRVRAVAKHGDFSIALPAHGNETSAPGRALA